MKKFNLKMVATVMNDMEHANSPKIASPKDSGLPTPSGSGKTADSS